MAPLFKQKLIFDDVFVFLLRYLGVEVTEGHFELEALASSRSKLAFEWHIEGPDGVRKEVVRSLCDNITKRGVPLTGCATKSVAHFGRTFRSHILVAHVGRTCWSHISVAHFGRTFWSHISVAHFGRTFRSRAETQGAFEPC